LFFVGIGHWHSVDCADVPMDSAISTTWCLQYLHDDTCNTNKRSYWAPIRVLATARSLSLDCEGRRYRIDPTQHNNKQ
jgi:hypothetical protein